MITETAKIIIGDDGHEMTTTERALAMIRAMEKQFHTGPIIGEARELLVQMSHNILARDLLLDVIGIDVDQREKVFKEVMDCAQKRDIEILEKRKQK